MLFWYAFLIQVYIGNFQTTKNLLHKSSLANSRLSRGVFCTIEFIAMGSCKQGAGSHLRYTRLSPPPDSLAHSPPAAQPEVWSGRLARTGLDQGFHRPSKQFRVGQWKGAAHAGQCRTRVLRNAPAARIFDRGGAVGLGSLAICPGFGAASVGVQQGSGWCRRAGTRSPSRFDMPKSSAGRATLRAWRFLLG